MKEKVYKIWEDFSGCGDPVVFANRNGVIENAKLVGGINIESLGDAIRYLRDNGYMVEEQPDVDWNGNYIEFTQGV